jgi:hypothetical protein
MLAAKFFDDQYFNNAYYAKVGGVPCNEMNSLELEFLFLVNFSLHVTPDVYTKYKEELTNHMEEPQALLSATQPMNVLQDGQAQPPGQFAQPQQPPQPPQQQNQVQQQFQQQTQIQQQQYQQQQMQQQQQFQQQTQQQTQQQQFQQQWPGQPQQQQQQAPPPGPQQIPNAGDQAGQSFPIPISGTSAGLAVSSS